MKMMKTKKELHEQAEINGALPLAILRDDSIGKQNDLVSEDKKEDFRCHWGKYSPDCVQPCHNSRWLLAYYTIMIIIQGAVINGVLSSSLSTLEKRFELTSTHSGIIAGTYDFGVVIVLVIVTFYGGQGHKGRWIAIGTVIMGIGSLLFGLPQFTTGLYQYNQSQDTLCELEGNSTMLCSSNTDGLSNYFWWFLFAQLLHGFGASPMYTLTFVYLDENVLQKNSAVYTSIFYVGSIVGPAVGYLASGQILKIYGDIGSVNFNSIELSQDDPRWYGAWWISFLVCGCAALIVSFPLFGFARELPGSSKYRKDRAAEAEGMKGGEITETVGFGKTLQDLPLALKLLLKNNTFLYCVLSDSMEGFLVGGYATFLPKFIENQFNLTASFASTLTGLILIPAAGGGALLSGIVMNRRKMNLQQILRYAFATIAASLFIGFTLFSSLACPNSLYAGVTTDFHTNNDRLVANLTADCNAQCGCNRYMHKPVCGDDNVMYFSPCHAGCSTQSDNATFSNCSCLQSSETFAKQGKCPASCHLMPVVLISIFIFVLLTFMASTPQIQIILRSVPFTQRALATGVAWVFARLLGSIPGPVVMGILIDTTCVLWGERCGQQASCLYYDNYTMAWKFVVLTLSVKALSFISMLVAWRTYKPEHEQENVKTSVNNTVAYLANNIYTTSDTAAETISTAL